MNHSNFVLKYFKVISNNTGMYSHVIIQDFKNNIYSQHIIMCVQRKQCANRTTTEDLLVGDLLYAIV